LVRGDNITLHLTRLTYATKTELLTGKTLIALAKNVIKEARKMSSLLPKAIKVHVLSRAANGKYDFPSGKTEDNFDHFMLKRMYKWEKCYGASGGATTEDEKDDAKDDEDDGSLGKVATDADVTMVVGNNHNNDDNSKDELVIPKEIFEIDNNEVPPIRDNIEDSDEEPDNSFLPKGWVVLRLEVHRQIKKTVWTFLPATSPMAFKETSNTEEDIFVQSKWTRKIIIVILNLITAGALVQQAES
jgi:hypothetical protein